MHHEDNAERYASEHVLDCGPKICSKRVILYAKASHLNNHNLITDKVASMQTTGFGYPIGLVQNMHLQYFS